MKSNHWHVIARPLPRTSVSALPARAMLDETPEDYGLQALLQALDDSNSGSSETLTIV